MTCFDSTKISECLHLTTASGVAICSKYSLLLENALYKRVIEQSICNNTHTLNGIASYVPNYTIMLFLTLKL